MDPFIFLEQINASNFEAEALATFERQYNNIPIYRQYADLLGKQHPQSLPEIPFLPIDFFKNQKVTLHNTPVIKTFQSSGTTQQNRSQHHLTDLLWYDAALNLGFTRVLVK